MNRREALSRIAGVATGTALGSKVLGNQRTGTQPAIEIDPRPLHDLSPYLYMQFMEPLGATDGSVEASWDHLNDCWRRDLVEVTGKLGATMVRWGGIFCDFYRWREGVGPRDKRVPMVNLLWGGIESNQVGTAEFVGFCRQVGADPLVCVNFESDGRERYMRYKESVRTADANEAAEWVAYCNQPDHGERIAHGNQPPLTVKHWQLGNETSYDRNGFGLEKAGEKTVEFARAMRAADPTIKLIGWGDSGWGPRMAEMAGERLDYLAFHHMFNPDDRNKPALRDLEYRKDPDRTWHLLMEAHKIHEQKIQQIRDSVADCGLPLAMTECHFAIPGRDRCDVLSTWAAGVSYARMLNVHQRHGDVLKIATAADFCGTRWNVNAVMLPVPGRAGAYMMPVARVMSLYRHHGGEQRVEVTRSAEGLDVVASRSGDRIFVHAVNTQRTKAITAGISVDGMAVTSGRVFEIAIEPEQEITQFNPDLLEPVEKKLPPGGEWTFPAASVSAIEIEGQGLS
jgi:alpha-L-arabinofuranosidase